jgi:hypothetical protein
MLCCAYKNKAMNILTYLDRFSTEDECRAHFRAMREKQGIICKKCCGKKHYWLQGKCQWQCSQCNFRTTLKSGTVLEESKMPFTKWYLVMAFMSFTKKGISAKEMQRQLGHKRYNTVWRMMHKVRSAMGMRDDLYQLSDMVEMDEGHFGIAIPEGTKLKRGKGSQRLKCVPILQNEGTG